MKESRQNVHTEKEQEELSLPTGKISGHDYVDLGLSVLWATCNIGADRADQYGDFFPWGEVTEVSSFSWDTYKFGKLGEVGERNHLLTKYISDGASSFGGADSTDGLSVLNPEDDAAFVQWGNEWRMPTRDEFRELCSNCTLKWVTINRHNGYLFTADNGESIFLPAAGNMQNDRLYWDESRYGFYWSASLNERKPVEAWGLYFHRGHADVSHGDRSRGFCIRPVADKRK